MPTGYTAKLMEHGMPFRAFVLQCASAMGACVMQRDDPIEEPPKKQEPSNFYFKKWDEAQLDYLRLNTLSPDGRYAHGAELRLKAITDADANLTRVRAENRRLDDMAIQVRAWMPPTDEHRGLKDFMLQQIEVSRGGDWAETHAKEVAEKPPEAYFVEALSNAHRNIRHYGDEMQKENERTSKRNEWIEQLYASLPADPDAQQERETERESTT